MKYFKKMYNKNFKKAFLIFVLGILFTSCKKEKAETPVINSLEGIWKGSYHYEGSSSQYSYRLKIKTGGILERMNGNETDGEGTWNIIGNQFAGIYKNLPAKTITYTVTGTLDINTKTITGTITSSSQVILPAVFILTKQ